MKLNPHFRRQARSSRESGYVLLMILLIIALMIIAATAVVTSITFDIKRDREEEMIHRGVQYSRAIRAYYKRNGRYPAKIEDLENTNNQRYLRKRYKDPLTGKDFKLLHFGDAKLAMSGGIPGGNIPGASAIGGNGGFNNNGGPGQTNSFVTNANFGGNNAIGNPNSAFGQNPAFGQNAQPNNQTNGSDPSQPNAQGNGPNPPGQDNNGSNGNGGSGDQPGNQTFGGGAIVGVASLSKDETIREYNHKKKYNEWQFVYDPATDRGGLITTPYQPMAAFGQMGMTPNLNGQINGTNSSPFGTGQPPAGMQNNPNLPPGGGYGTPNQPSNPPQQQ